MIDLDTARVGLSALGTAIGEIMEDSVGVALSVAPVGSQAARAEVLASAGRDIEVLARAMATLVAHTEGD